MEQYKQEFIEFMVDSQVLNFGERQKDPFFCKYRLLPYGCAAQEAGRILCQSDS